MNSLFYCSNVFPASDYSRFKDLLQLLAESNAQNIGPRFQFGLWFCRDLLNECALRGEKVSELVSSYGLSTQTLNGFPYGRFHDKVVKHQVYLPDWSDSQRVEYTQEIAKELCTLLGNEPKGTISTLPLGWKNFWSSEKESRSRKNLIEMVKYLRSLKQQTGKTIQLCLEPEPGCVLELCDEVLDYWPTLLSEAKLSGVEEESVLQHLGVCIDSCHQAVQFEESPTYLQSLLNAGIEVGKFQISLAPEFHGVSRSSSAELEKRRLYCDEKFLHQTRSALFYQNFRESKNVQWGAAWEDLPEALLLAQIQDWQESWRVHYHIPLFITPYLKKNQGIHTTLDHLKTSLAFAWKHFPNCHFEIETYTWNVLPEEIRPKNHHDLLEKIKLEVETVYQWKQHGISP